MAKILIVEDDRFLSELITQKIGAEGYEVSLAMDGEQALVKAKEEKPHLILLDLILPTMDGFAVLQQLKASPETQNIPVIILSNLGQKEDVERGMQLGAIDFMIKANFTPNEIIAKIKGVIQ